ncbi:MAG: hypothetical protein NVSMB52_16600 [Chloroflexota bacterium]
MIRRRFGSLLFATFVAFGAPAMSVLALTATPTVALAKSNGCDAANTNDNQGCDIPEVPTPLGIPVAGMAVFGGYVWFMRRRSSRSKTSFGGTSE